jgi:hypothetical protein
MIKTEYKNDNTQKVIEALLEELLKQGAEFNSDIILNEFSGNLSISQKNTSTSNEYSISVPLICMPLLCDYDITLKPNLELSATLKENSRNIRAKSVLVLLLDLYNSTRKIEEWKKVYPLLTLKKHKELIEILFLHRPQAQKLTSYLSLYKSNLFEQLLLKSFLGSREFTYKKDALASAGIKTPNDSEKGLLAIIDFLNHKMGDSSYVINRATGCMEIHASNVDESGEIFVQYGFMDALQTFLTYAFVDVNAPIYFSGKIQFRLKSGLNFVILGMAGGLQRTVPLPLEQQHLNQYLPPGIKRQGEHIVVNELVIPSGEQLSYLSESLSVIIKQCDVDNIYKDESILESEIQHIEQQVLTLNIQFWQQFAGLVERAIKSDSQFNNTTAKDLQALIDTSITHCNSYAAHKGYKI